MHFQTILVTLAAISLLVAYSAPVPASGSSSLEKIQERIRVLKEDNATLLAKVNALMIAAYEPEFDPIKLREFQDMKSGPEMREYNKKLTDLQDIKKRTLRTQARFLKRFKSACESSKKIMLLFLLK
jgi:hypothetical protein